MVEHATIRLAYIMESLLLETRIYTGDPLQPFAAAVGIARGRIVAVGQPGAVRAQMGSKARPVRLPEGLAVPGLVDGHGHFLQWALARRRLDLRGLDSLAACRERVRDAARRAPWGSWIIGRGWNQYEWSERREPSRRDLDDIAPDHPVLLVRVCGHGVWVNSRALAAAGITRASPDPPGGCIVRDPETGEPHGLVREGRRLFEACIPRPTLAERTTAVFEAQQEALRLGLTGMHTSEGIQAWRAWIPKPCGKRCCIPTGMAWRPPFTPLGTRRSPSAWRRWPPCDGTIPVREETGSNTYS